MRRNQDSEDIVFCHIRRLVEMLNKPPKDSSEHDFHSKLVSLLIAWREWIAEYQNRVEQWKEEGSKSDMLPIPYLLKVPAGCPSLDEMQRCCRVVFTLNVNGERTFPGIFYSLPIQKGESYPVWHLVAQQFVSLIQSPLCHKFGGPCLRCGKFFLRETAKRKQYCSGECARIAFACAATARRREAEREERLAEVRAAIEEWGACERRSTWEAWVYKKIPDLTKNWLTRAINQRTIVPPRGLVPIARERTKR
jgi:hypothetical protein